jgi:hypothetical protein
MIGSSHSCQLSWIKNRLKNLTVMPAPMQVIKSESARMKGTCLELRHFKRALLIGLDWALSAS